MTLAGSSLLARLATWLLACGLAAAVVQAVGTLDRLSLLVLATAPVAALVWLHPLIGAACLLGYASVLGLLVRLLPPASSGPIGIALDGLLLLLGLRLALDLARGRDWRRLASPLTLPVVIFSLYQGLEALNPASPSLAMGLQGLRLTGRTLGFFLMLYYLRDLGDVRRFGIAWLAMMGGVCAYGIFQHHHGLLWQEMAWLLSEGNATTHILGGHVRVFSTVGDAATFGFLMGMAALQALSAAHGARGATRWVFGLGVLPLLYAMALSYSRGPVVGVLAGFTALCAASRSWRLAAGGALLGTLGLVILLTSGSNRLVDRLATATRPGEDASFNVRLGYIAAYVPEIARRPFGYGIATSGGGARKLAGGATIRDTPVGVPTDNYYFKVALELGWVGLSLWLWLAASLGYLAWRVCRQAGRDKARQTPALALFASLTALLVGALSNDILAQRPIAEGFWIIAGLIAWLGTGRGVGRRTGATPLEREGTAR